MYLIDNAYFDYERKLTNEDEAGNSLGAIGSLAANAVGAAIPAGQATKVLSAVAGGLTGVTALYDKQFLLSQTIQNLQTTMRTDRKHQAAVIYERLKCDPARYNMGLVFSDLEAYARFGTIESALQGIQKTVTKAEAAAQTAKETAGQQGKKTNTTELATYAAALTTEAQTLPAADSCPIPELDSSTATNTPAPHSKAPKPKPAPKPPAPPAAPPPAPQPPPEGKGK